MPRFFLPATQLRDAQFVVLDGENATHAKALRLKAGDVITLCDAEGTDYCAAVRDISPGRIGVEITTQQPGIAEPQLAASVYMAFAKADKFEHVIQKATELGAFEVVAFPTARCVSRPDEKSLAKKCERWQRIAASAAEQCGRSRIPQVLALTSYSEALSRAVTADLSVFLYENEEKLSLKNAVVRASFATVSLMTGPEGGFEPEEVLLAQNAGMRVCSLGPRILRCETAPLCALSALMYAAGELEER